MVWVQWRVLAINNLIFDYCCFATVGFLEERYFFSASLALRSPTRKGGLVYVLPEGVGGVCTDSGGGF